MTNHENPNEFYEQSDKKKGLISALALHGLLVLALLLGLLDSPDQAAGPVQVELWAEGTEQVVKAPAESRAKNPGQEDTKVDDQEQTQEPVKKAPEVKQAPPKVTPPAEKPEVPKVTPKAQENPEIVLEKKRKEEKERQDKLEQEQALKRKQEQEQKELAKKQKAEQEKQELIKKQQEEQAQKELAQKQKEEKEKKEKELAQKQQEEQAKKDAQKKEKALADAKKAKEAKSKAQNEGDSLRASMRGDINSIAGIKGGINDRNQRGGGGGDSNIIRAVQACVQPRLRFSGSQRLQVNYEVNLNNNLQPSDAKITRRSTNPAFDRAVQNALMACNPYPKVVGKNRLIKGTFKFPE